MCSAYIHYNYSYIRTRAAWKYKVELEGAWIKLIYNVSGGCKMSTIGWWSKRVKKFSATKNHWATLVRKKRIIYLWSDRTFRSWGTRNLCLRDTAILLIGDVYFLLIAPPLSSKTWILFWDMIILFFVICMFVRAFSCHCTPFTLRLCMCVIFPGFLRGAVVHVGNE